jgi:RNA polymerase-binding transcription factor DksA
VEALAEHDDRQSSLPRGGTPAASASLATSGEDALARLQALHADLEAQLLSTEEGGEETPHPRFSNHLAEDAHDQQQSQNIGQIRHMLLRDLRDVEHAMQRATAGAYGICEECGHEIPPRRLLIIPSATLCVNCQMRREARGVPR